MTARSRLRWASWILLGVACLAVLDIAPLLAWTVRMLAAPPSLDDLFAYGPCWVSVLWGAAIGPLDATLPTIWRTGVPLYGADTAGLLRILAALLAVLVLVPGILLLLFARLRPRQALAVS